MAVKTVQIIINGTTVNLSLNSSTGLYEGNVTAPSKSSYNVNSGHYYPVTIKAVDSAGNSTTANDTTATLGSKLRLTVKETTKPVITVTSPTEGAMLTNNKPTIQWKVTDDDSGVNSGTIAITIDSGSKVTSGITKTAITGGYQCSYVIPSALSDGSHAVKLDASDFDGNEATERTVNFKVDTVPPTLSVTSPANNLITNNSSVTVSGTTSDVTSSPVTLTVKLNSGSAQSVTVGSNGAFSKTLTLANGLNTIVVTATDAAGKTSSVTRKVTLDTSAPIISDIVISPNPVSTGAVLSIKATVTD